MQDAMHQNYCWLLCSCGHKTRAQVSPTIEQQMSSLHCLFLYARGMGCDPLCESEELIYSRQVRQFAVP